MLPSTVAPLPADEITIWHIDLVRPPALMPPLHALLSPAERARAARFLYPHHRHRYIVAHAALRTILAPLVDIAPMALTFAQGPHGKPFLEGHHLHFNLTHAGGLALLAISPTRHVGIDLEPLRPMPDALALAEQFHPNELAHLRATHPDPHVFFTCWTRKEAFVKATGEGLTRALSSFDTTTAIRGWNLVDLPIPNHCATLVVEATTPEPPPIQHRPWYPNP